MDIRQFTDGPTRGEIWELPDAGWDDWAIVVDRFLAHAIRGIAVAYCGQPVAWLEINYWQHSGRLIVFPSQNGPSGDRGERVCFELSSEHLEAASGEISSDFPAEGQEQALESFGAQVWRRVGECFVGGAAAVALVEARRSFALCVAGYDYNPGEGPLRLTDAGAFLM